MFHVSYNPSQLYFNFYLLHYSKSDKMKEFFSCRQYLPWHWNHLIKRCIDVALIGSKHMKVF